MKNVKSHFVFNTKERNGIFLLVFIVLVLQAIYFFWDFEENDSGSFFENEKQAEAVQQQIDSLKNIASEGNEVKIYPFNPNFMTDFKAYTLGISPEEADKLFEHRKQDKWVNSPQEFQEVTGVSDSLLSEIEPFFKFTEFTKRENNKFFKTKKPPISLAEKKDLNKATAEALQEINGVGEVLSQRIVSYRNKIGGFVGKLQLKDVYGLNPDVIEAISAVYKVLPSEKIERIDINTATVLQLSEIIYFDYELAREIIDYRLLNEKITSFEELSKIPDFPSEKIDRIQLYLTIN